MEQAPEKKDSDPRPLPPIQVDMEQGQEKKDSEPRPLPPIPVEMEHVQEKKDSEPCPLPPIPVEMEHVPEKKDSEPCPLPTIPVEMEHVQEKKDSEPCPLPPIPVEMEHVQEKKDSEPRPLPPITDLRVTLVDPDLLPEFRNYLKTLKKFEPLLDYLLLCMQVFELPESEVDTKVRLMVELYKKFLAPKSHNVALASQINRKALIAHCKDLEKGVTDQPDENLLREGYNFVFQKIEQKHDLWRRTYKPPTTLKSILCNII